MIQDTIRKIEAAIRNSSTDPKKKEEAIRLLASLKSEVEALSKTHGAHAESIDRHLTNSAWSQLSSSVTEFEGSHPKLVQTVNDICRLLANIGI